MMDKETREITQRGISAGAHFARRWMLFTIAEWTKTQDSRRLEARMAALHDSIRAEYTLTVHRIEDPKAGLVYLPGIISVNRLREQNARKRNAAALKPFDFDPMTFPYAEVDK